MFKRIFNSTQFSWKLHKVGKLYNEGECKRALELLDGLKGSKEEMAKLLLFKADILHRDGELLKSVAQYEKFLFEGLSEIKGQNDKNYLRLYAQYYLASVKTKSGQIDVVPVLRAEVVAAFQEATLLVRADFVI
jgi:hypothetical protein